MSKNFLRIDEVVAWRLCMGCGACVAACPNKAVFLMDVFDKGIRPKIDKHKCQSCGDCLKVCPGISLSHDPFIKNSIPELQEAWGPVLGIWEGYACDPEIRFKGSSGGAATALALYCLENGIANGVLHIGVDRENPIKNVPVYSKTKDQLLACTGSRYAPAALCQAFDILKEKDGKSIFIGKPCDVAALRKSQEINPILKEKVILAISIFCAGTPSTAGSHKVLERLGVKPEEVEVLRYRGCGWPGMTTAKLKGDSGNIRQMPYEESWGKVLCEHVSLRCHLCPDATGEFADIACGDPWYREIEPEELGRSMILARTEKGQELLLKSIKSGYLQLERVKPDVLPASQKSVYNKRRNLWGRLFAFRIFGIPIPEYEGFELFKHWKCLSTKDQGKSVLGTINRIFVRKWLFSEKGIKL